MSWIASRWSHVILSNQKCFWTPNRVDIQKDLTISKNSNISAIGMKSRLVGFLKQAKNRVSD